MIYNEWDNIDDTYDNQSLGSSDSNVKFTLQCSRNIDTRLPSSFTYGLLLAGKVSRKLSAHEYSLSFISDSSYS